MGADRDQDRKTDMGRRDMVGLGAAFGVGSMALGCVSSAAAQTADAPTGMTVEELPVRSIRSFGVRPENHPTKNSERLQEAIDWAHPRGAGLWVEPSADPYSVSAGIRLKSNVTLFGPHGPMGRGTRHPRKPQPVGSVLRVVGDHAPFITVESGSQLRGLQFWYPSQPVNLPSRVEVYPPTIQVAQDANVYSVTLSNLTFYGEWMAFDFVSKDPHINEQIVFEHCYGYPLSGRFIAIDRCYDIPRILHCHVNPAVRRLIEGQYSPHTIDAVVGRGEFTYAIDHTDNAVLSDLFTFGNHGGVRLGAATYGQLTGFNLDCVTVGIHKSGDGNFNRNWQIAQGSIIANCGKSVDQIHPIVIDGRGHTSLSNVEAFSGTNGALTTFENSQDYMKVGGTERLTATLSGCRMANYAAEQPFTIDNPEAALHLSGCLDKHEHFLPDGPLGLQVAKRADAKG